MFLFNQKKGEKANMNQAEVDHIFPKSKRGTNSFFNALVLSKKENLLKSNKLKWERLTD